MDWGWEGNGETKLFPDLVGAVGNVDEPGERAHFPIFNRYLFSSNSSTTSFGKHRLTIFFYTASNASYRKSYLPKTPNPLSSPTPFHIPIPTQNPTVPNGYSNQANIPTYFALRCMRKTGFAGRAGTSLTSLQAYLTSEFRNGIAGR